jgi:hypothetical protein
MENNFSEIPNSSLFLDLQAQEALKESAKWCLFIAIIGFIGLGFLILIAIFMAINVNSLPDNFAENSSFVNMKAYISIVYVLLAALYFPFVYYLYKYASDMKLGIASQNTATISEALVSLKAHHKFLGVSIIVLMSIYIFMIVGVIVMFTLK